MSQRRFIDTDGWTWEALECPHAPPSRAPGATEHPVLYFMSRFETRRLDDVPANWSALPAAGLAKLCDLAVPLEDLVPA